VERGRVNRRIAAQGNDLYQDRVYVPLQVFIAEADHSQVLALQELLANEIRLALLEIIVNSAVDLNHEAGVDAVEIDDESPNWMLSAELQPM
jgi:hypothetical protein